VADSGQLSSQAMLLLPSPSCAGCDFLTVLGAHEGEGLVVEHDAAVSVHGSLPACMLPASTPCQQRFSLAPADLAGGACC
jgi:hypothetical protein